MRRFPGAGELLFDTGFGDPFVVRNAGTMSNSVTSAAGPWSRPSFLNCD
jgi:carbonic anhydrase